MGIRVIKTAIAAVAALYLAQWFGLEQAMSAGLLAILGMDVTRKRSLRSASARIAASIVGLLYGVLIFYIFGFHVWVVALYILGAYPVLSRAGLKDGIVTSSVMVLQIFFREDLSAAAILNQIMLLFVGLGSATVVNMIYMPSWEGHIQKEREKLETAISEIFMEFAMHLRDPSRIWSGSQLIDAVNAVKAGKTYAHRASDNALFHRDDEWHTYFTMRERQLEIIQRMFSLVARVYEDVPHGAMIADLFDELRHIVKQEYYGGSVARHLTELSERFKGMPLPSSRKEFETRAALLELMFDLGHFLDIAKALKKKKSD